MENTMNRMKQENVHVAALITGGFHSEGISELMDEEKLSYLVVMPKFDDKSADRPYIAVMTQKPKEYEEAFKDSDFYLAAGAFFELGGGSIWSEAQKRTVAETSLAVVLAGVRISVG